MLRNHESPFLSDNFLLGISNGHKNGANISFSVQSKTFPKLKAQIWKMRSQNVPEASGFILT